MRHFVVTVSWGARIRAVLFALLMAAPLLCAFGGVALAQDQAADPLLQQGGNDADLWRAVREGARGSVTIPDKKAGILIQSSGETWRAIRNGPLPEWGAWAMLGMIILLALFFAVRGRIRIESGRSGVAVERFGFLDRLGWATG
jgi:formate dehydrogenase subunit gamma